MEAGNTESKDKESAVSRELRRSKNTSKLSIDLRKETGVHKKRKRERNMVRKKGTALELD